LGEFWGHPPWRTALDACVAFKSPEHRLHLWRKPVERAAILVRSNRANLDRLFQQPAIRVTFHENKALFLILEHIVVHHMKIVFEQTLQFRRTEGGG
jgi:hypothetical protein